MAPFEFLSLMSGLPGATLPLVILVVRLKNELHLATLPHVEFLTRRALFRYS